MSKVVIRTNYSSNGKSVGVGYINYMAQRERVDKSINTKRVEINLNKARSDILNHHGTVWLPIVSLRREDADRLRFNNADAWRNLISTQKRNRSRL